MEKTPLISVIMPLYNAEQYVLEAIKSLQVQTYSNWELVVVNDGSTDKSVSVVEKIQDKRVRVYSKENAGACAARNFGFFHSHGDYVKFFDADDLINSTMLEEQVKLAIANPDCVISSKWGRFYNNSLSTFMLNPEECWQSMPSLDWICTSWKKAQSMTQPAMFLLPRELINKAGLWNERLSLVDDFEYFTRTILTAKSVIFCPEACLYYRSGISNNLSGQKSEKALLSAILSVDLATGYLLARLNNETTRRLCANSLKTLLYEFWLTHPDILKPAEAKIQFLGGSDLTFPGGAASRCLSELIGWKNALRLRELSKYLANWKTI